MAEEVEGNTEQPPELPFDFAEGWPQEVRDQVARVVSFDLEQVQGKQRLGDLSFDNAPDRVRSIRDVLADLAREPWEDLPSEVRSQLGPQTQAAIETVEAMIALSPRENPNAHAEKEGLESRLDELGRWFREQRPHALKARVDRVLDERESSMPTADVVKDAREAVQDIQKRLAEQSREIDARSDVISSLRQVSGESAGEDLTKVFRDRADELGRTARTWFKALIVASCVALGGAILNFVLLRPDRGSNDPTDFAALGLAVFILGLLAFGVRVCAQNYRVNKHLQAVANSKAAALGTFVRLVASIEQEDIRSAVSLTLAQAVFATEETGLVDGSGDHVTLVERIVAPRLSSTGTPPVT